MYKKPYVIAEIGCNHKGDMNIAKELIKMAKKRFYLLTNIKKFGNI